MRKTSKFFYLEKQQHCRKVYSIISIFLASNYRPRAEKHHRSTFHLHSYVYYPRLLDTALILPSILFGRVAIQRSPHPLSEGSPIHTTLACSLLPFLGLSQALLVSLKWWRICQTWRCLCRSSVYSQASPNASAGATGFRCALTVAVVMPRTTPHQIKSTISE